MGGQEIIDRKLEAFKKLVPHLRGALWWGSNPLIQERNSTFNQSDTHKGHPLLSLRKDEVAARGDVIPMLVGTSGSSMRSKQRQYCIEIVGMTKRKPEHRTYFGSIIEPGIYSVKELLDSVTPKKGEYIFAKKKTTLSRKEEGANLTQVSRFVYHTMFPNWDKPMADESEMKMIDAFCLIHQLSEVDNG
ncbi:MAG: hypothetical protein J5985_03325 [Kiritimatiellae bacterium]|nr:hypothetical protein [Kiritimatiellia bacterium]